MPTFKVRLFGEYRRAAKTRELLLNFPSGAVLADLLEYLSKEFDDEFSKIVADGRVRDDVMISLDGQIVRDLNYALGDVQVIDISPVVGGG